MVEAARTSSARRQGRARLVRGEDQSRHEPFIIDKSEAISKRQRQMGVAAVLAQEVGLAAANQNTGERRPPVQPIGLRIFQFPVRAFESLTDGGLESQTPIGI